MLFYVGVGRVDEVADEPVGYVYMVGAVLGGGVLLEDWADCYLLILEVAEFAGPFFVGVYVGEDDDFAALQDFEFVFVELGLSTGGEPDVFGHQAGADYCGFLGFYEGYWFVGFCGKQVFSEQALSEFPVGRKLAGLLHQGVDPSDAAFCVFVFDAVTGVGVVFHYFACADLAFSIYLEEDCVSGVGDADLVAVYERINRVGVENCPQVCYEVAVSVVADGASDYILRK